MWIEFADRYVPDGNCTTPPPAPAAASMASWIAAVSLVEPLPVAPKSRTLNVAALAGEARMATASRAVVATARPRLNTRIAIPSGRFMGGVSPSGQAGFKTQITAHADERSDLSRR